MKSSTITEKQLKKIEHYINALFLEDTTGHDFFHMRRVANMAKYIATHEGEEPSIAEACGWLHDVGDSKIFNNPTKMREKLFLFLKSIQIDAVTVDHIGQSIEDISYVEGRTPVKIYGKIVQDADRLDALGAIGIARTFAFGGAHNQKIYSDTNDEQTSIQHFFEKLLLLKQTLHTDTAKVIANERHEVMENYLRHFFNEWHMI